MGDIIKSKEETKERKNKTKNWNLKVNNNKRMDKKQKNIKTKNINKLTINKWNKIMLKKKKIKKLIKIKQK